MVDIKLGREPITLTPIGQVTSCFDEKFGAPRQSGLTPSAKARLKFFAPFNNPAAFEGLEGVSHLWVHYLFHQNAYPSFQPKVRPPRLGGNAWLGVFATRSPFRPNGLGLSLVKLESIQTVGQDVALEVSGVDMISGTPIIDIKPYVPYADCITEAINTIADMAPMTCNVTFSAASEKDLKWLNLAGFDLRDLIEEVLQQDPRPQYHPIDATKEYGMTLSGFNIRWRCGMDDGQKVINVISISAPETVHPLENHSEG